MIGFEPGMIGFEPGMTGFEPGMIGFEPGMIGFEPGMIELEPGMIGFEPGMTGFEPGITGFVPELYGGRSNRSANFGPTFLISFWLSVVCIKTWIKVNSKMGPMQLNFSWKVKMVHSGLFSSSFLFFQE